MRRIFQISKFPGKDKSNEAMVIWAFQDSAVSYHPYYRSNLKRISLCEKVCGETQSQNVPTSSLCRPLSQHCEIPELRGIWCEQDNTAPVWGSKWPLILTGLQEFMPRLDPFCTLEWERLLYNSRHCVENSSIRDQYWSAWLPYCLC